MAELENMDEKQYIVAKLGDEQYGIDIAYVDNIVRMQKITHVPSHTSLVLLTCVEKSFRL